MHEAQEGRLGEGRIEYRCYKSAHQFPCTFPSKPAHTSKRSKYYSGIVLQSYFMMFTNASTCRSYTKKKVTHCVITSLGEKCKMGSPISKVLVGVLVLSLGPWTPA